MEAEDESILAVLETYFQQAKLPREVKIAAGSTVFDLPKFIQAQLNIVRGQNSWAVRLPAYERLLQLKVLLEDGGMLQNP